MHNFVIQSPDDKLMGAISYPFTSFMLVNARISNNNLTISIRFVMCACVRASGQAREWEQETQTHTMLYDNNSY